MKWFKKKEKQNEEETTNMTTLEQIKKAYADFSEDAAVYSQNKRILE